MTEAEALVDNDVLYKTSMYGFAQSIFQTEPYGATQFHILGAAKFIIRKKLVKRPPARGAELALAEFESVLSRLRELEPTSEEISLAANLEYLAGQAGHQLDNGESLLCAVLVARNRKYIFTGDKRAISAIGALRSHEIGNALSGRLVCLEQLVMYLIQHIDASPIRNSICGEPKVDRALTSCFACQSLIPPADVFNEGLASYIGHIQQSAPGVLYNELND